MQEIFRSVEIRQFQIVFSGQKSENTAIIRVQWWITSKLLAE
jgi:hypothetical protein